MGISQSNPSSSATIEKKFEVFLSFRGETRHGFTNNLYEALRDKSIETFRDDRLEKGDEIGPNLLKTIRESKISVVIFSKDYASSKWCLRELVEIMECREKNGRTVIPVFYNVAVSDVRHQEGSFKDGFDQLEKKFLEKLAKDRAAWTEHVDSANVSKQSESCMASFDERPKEFHIEMQKWREALTKASHVDGYDSSVTRPDSVLINELVRSISEKLMSEYMPSPCDFKGLYGFEERFKQVMSLLCLDNTDIRIIGIWGMGGIGKTTIADAIFHQIPYDEYGKCFIQNVRQRLEQCGGLVSVQQEVLSKVLNDQDIKLDSLTLPRHIKERLCRKKVFIVLDDVDNFLKLQKLAGGIDRLGLGSRIIITTRRRDILYNCGVNDDYIYEVKGLSNQEAHQLFCEYAFRQSPLPEDLMALSHKILWAINGNPLGLIVAGSSLLKLNKVEWQSALNRLKKSSEILEVLKISYNGLEDEDKHTFLDIACFFVGKHVDYLVKILDNCSHSLRVLFHRSLITISNDKIIQMHDLLQEMGREIVCREDLNNPGNRSRLWTQEDVLDTLKNDDGTTAVRGIFLNMSKMNVEHLSSQAFEKMKNLRILKFYDSAWYYNFVVNGAELYSSNVRFSNDISYLSNKLKSLNWLGYPLKALPSNFIPKNLVELNLRHSNIEMLWEDNRHAPKLKWIILKSCPYLLKVNLLDAPLLEKIDIVSCESLLGLPSHNRFLSLAYLHLKSCKKLTRISNLLDAPLLKKIDIQRCENLLGFPSPVHNFNNLHELNIRDCKNFQSFPNNIPFLSLVSLDLSGCMNLAKISDLLDAPLLQKINLCDCKSLLNFPPPVNHFNNLRELNMRDCQNLQSFPNNIPFPSLVSLDLSGCINLARISDLLDAPLVQMIDLCHCKSLLNFPPPAHHFNNLRELNMRNCKNLQSFPKNVPFLSLVSIDLSGCIKLARISYIFDAPLLQMINLCDCKSLLDFPLPAHHFHNLHELNIRDCPNLQSFPNNIPFPSLVSLDLSRCINLARISDLLDTPLLQMINLCDYKSLLDFPPPAHHFNNLRKLNMRDCQNLRSFPNNIPFPSLVSLDLSRCINLARISDLLDTPLVQMINLCDCKSLLEFPPPAHHFNNLRELNIRDCQNLQSFPNNIPFPSIVSLDLSRCINLARISDLLDAPLLQVVNLCGCKSLRDFPPPARHFNNLCELNMRDCENILSFPNNIPFPSLISLDLSKCINLARISDFLDAPLLENINLINCKSLIDFPPPAQHFNKLRNLKLNYCKNLQSFPSNNIHFPSLNSFEINGCIKLTKCPHISGNIKKLYMRNTAIKDVPSSIENLPRLVKLDLAGCTRLKQIPNNIHKLKALKKLNLSNCSALECFPEISDTMGSLKILNLRGTAIKELHHSIENLSGLEMMYLCECKNLEMLPISIYNLTSLNILSLSGCSKLENFPTNSVTDLSNRGESATTKSPICRLGKCELYFTNCLNLNKTAVTNIMELQINQQRDMTTKGIETQAVDLMFFYPGSEVLSWFKHRTDGFLINIQMSGYDGLNGHLIGLAACAVIEFYDDEGYDFEVLRISIGYRHHCHCKDHSGWIDNIIVPLLYSDHVALWYSNALVLELCGECTNYFFEFYPKGGSPNCRVKYCGVCPIYEKHNINLPSIANETCGATDLDFGETSVK